MNKSPFNAVSFSSADVKKAGFAVPPVSSASVPLSALTPRTVLIRKVDGIVSFAPAKK